MFVSPSYKQGCWNLESLHNLSEAIQLENGEARVQIQAVWPRSVQTLPLYYTSLK